MQCDAYLPLISGHLDNQNSTTEEKRLQAHLKTCKHCRALLKQFEQNDALLCDATPEPPAELTQKIMERVKQEPRFSPQRRKWISLGAGALATAALLALVLLQVVPSAKDAAAGELLGAKTAVTQTAAAPSLPPDCYETAEPLSDEAMLNSYEKNDLDLAVNGQDAVIDELPELSVPTAPVTAPPTAPPTAPRTEALTQPPTELTTTAEPPKPERHKPITSIDEPALSEPLLVVWGTDLQLPEQLSQLQSVEVPAVSAPPESLQQRFLSALPLLRRELDKDNPLAQQITYTVSAFRTEYTAFSELLESLLGSYELAAYYPVATEYMQVTVLFIGRTQEIPEQPNS